MTKKIAIGFAVLFALFLTYTGGLLAGQFFEIDRVFVVTGTLTLAPFFAFFAGRWIGKKLHTQHFISTVEYFEGACVPVWVNKSQVDYKFTGAYTGFFKPAKKLFGLPLYVGMGEEFHGYFKADGTIATTKGHYVGHLDGV